MSGETMPERLAILRSDEDDCLCVAPLTLLGHDKVQEYIRADLVPTQTSETSSLLRDGEWRWTKLFSKEKWTPRQVQVWYGDPLLSYSGDEDGLHEVSEMAEIGPVVQPPPGK